LLYEITNKNHTTFLGSLDHFIPSEHLSAKKLFCECGRPAIAIINNQLICGKCESWRALGKKYHEKE